MTIGIFDSGIGGLGIFEEIKKLLPDERILYLADTANCPYGKKSEERIKQICLDNANFLIDKGADIIVVACNTASTVALQYVRDKIRANPRHYPRKSSSTKVVGVVPVVKTCAEGSKNKRIGILATKRTVESQYLRDLVEKFCPKKEGFEVYYVAANRLVEIVESGIMNYELWTNHKSEIINHKFSDPNLKLIENYLQFFKEKNVDMIALGCTHFPFLRPQIEQIMGPKVKVLDSNGAVARQTARIMNYELGIRNDVKNNKDHDSLFMIPACRQAWHSSDKYHFFTSGDPQKLQTKIKNLIGLKSVKVDKITIK